MLQFFDTLQDTSGNALAGTATITVTAYPGGGAAAIYSTNGTAAPITGSVVTADATGQVSFFIPDGAYIFTYRNNGTVYKTRSPVQVGDPMGFVAATDTGIANAYVVSDSRFPLSLYTGLKFEWKAANSNTGGSTLNLNGTGAQALVYPGGSAITIGQIQAGGLYRAEWDGSKWQLSQCQSPPVFVQTQTEINAGVTPTNLTYTTSPFYDIRRYGFVGDGVTDDSGAWAKLALVIGQGASGFVPPGPTMIKAQVTITAPAYQRVVLWAQGTEIYTTGAIYALTIQGGFMGGLTVKGATHVNTTDSLALGGFNIFGAQNCVIEDCWAYLSSTIPTSANYAGIVLQPTDPTNDNTGAFWNRILRFGVRQSGGSIPNQAPYGILILGGCNATNIQDCNFVAATNHIQIQNQIGGSNTGTLANAVVIMGCAFEGQTGSSCVYVNGQSSASASNNISGLRVIGCRAENLTTFLSINNVAVDASVPPMLYGNYFVSNVTNYYVSAGAVTTSIASWDPSITPDYLSANTSMVSGHGFKFLSKNNNADSLQAIAQNAGSGFGLYALSGTDLWHARMRSGAGAQVSAPNGAWYIGVQSISQTATEAKNLRGTATFAAATSIAVTFGTAEPDASYFIALSGNAAGYCWVTAKGTGGFTINCSASNSNTVDWHLIR